MTELERAELRRQIAAMDDQIFELQRQGKGRGALCRIHAATILQRLAKEAGEHPTLMAILRKKEEKQARGERSNSRGELTELAKQRGFKQGI